MCKLERLFWSSLVTGFNFVSTNPCQSKKFLSPGRTPGEILRWIIGLFSRKSLEKAFLQRQISTPINPSSSSRPIDLRPTKDLYGSAYIVRLLTTDPDSRTPIGNKNLSRLKLFFFLLLILCLSACSGGSITKKKVSDSSEGGPVLWEAGEQYVRLSSSDQAVDNQHPVDITTEEMRTVLESLFVPERHFISKKLYPVFSSAEIQVLSSALAKGLAVAQPDQDVTFVTVGFHPGLLTKVREANTGRVFFKNGKLQIIFGMLHHEIRDHTQAGEQIDRRLHPFVVGSRLFENKLSSTVALDAGQSFHFDPKSDKEREDWLVLDIPAIVAKAGHKVPKAADEQQQVSPELTENTAHDKQEIQNLKEDLANVREVVFELKERLIELQQKDKDATVKKRLRSLKDLHDSGLISNDEYRAKRQELLKDL